MNVTETCSCGARFTISSAYSPHIESATTTWRTEHRHAELVPSVVLETEGPSAFDVIDRLDKIALILKEVGERVALVGRVVAARHPGPTP